MTEKQLNQHEQQMKMKELENRILFLEDFISEMQMREYEKDKLIQQLISDMSEAVKVSLNRAYADHESFMILMEKEIFPKIIEKNDPTLDKKQKV